MPVWRSRSAKQLQVLTPGRWMFVLVTNVDCDPYNNAALLEWRKDIPVSLQGASLHLKRKDRYTWAQYQLVQQKPACIWSVCTAVFLMEAGLMISFCQRDMHAGKPAYDLHLQQIAISADQCVLAGGLPHVRIQRHSGGDHCTNIICVSMAICHGFFHWAHWVEQKKNFTCVPD